MPALGPLLLGVLQAVAAWFFRRFFLKLLGAAAIGGAVVGGWESGLIPLVLKSFVLVGMDIVFIFVDKLITFFLYVLQGTDLELPDINSVMDAVPSFVIQAGTAIGLWKSLALLWTIMVFKFVVGIFTMRIIFRR